MRKKNAAQRAGFQWEMEARTPKCQAAKPLLFCWCVYFVLFLFVLVASYTLNIMRFDVSWLNDTSFENMCMSEDVSKCQGHTVPKPKICRIIGLQFADDIIIYTFTIIYL